MDAFLHAPSEQTTGPNIMSSKITSDRAVYLCGLKGKRIIRLKTLCARKNCIRRGPVRANGKDIKIKKIKRGVLGMVSHPSLHKSKTAPYVKAWCHPYRDPDQYFPKDVPKLLLSES